MVLVNLKSMSESNKDAINFFSILVSFSFFVCLVFVRRWIMAARPIEHQFVSSASIVFVL